MSFRIRFLYSPPAQTFPPKRHRLRTFFILFLLMLALLVALSAVLGPNLFAKSTWFCIKFFTSAWGIRTIRKSAT